MINHEINLVRSNFVVICALEIHLLDFNFGGIAAALFNPFSVPVEGELAVPVVLAVGVVSLVAVEWSLD